MRSHAPLSVVLPLLALLAGAACDSSPSAAEPEEDGPDITWLKQAAVTLHAVDPGATYPDMPALAAMIGDARIVGLGEATHGTHEFFRMKHRTLQYLVEHQGFSTFGIEASFADAMRLNRYVLTGEGDSRAALAGLQFWTWNTSEVLEMIEWMRAYNADPAHTRKVTFWGFDMQFSRLAMNDVAAYLRKVQPSQWDWAESQYWCFRLFQDSTSGYKRDYLGALQDVKDECRKGVWAVDSVMEANADRFSAITGRAEYDVARQASRTVVQNEDARRYLPEVGMRDRYMAENVAWMAETGAPGTKLVLWAHNLHVGRAPSHGMGLHLTKRFGDAYRIVGFSFYTGTVSAVLPGDGLQHLQTLVPPESSYEHQFHRLGLGGFIVDLRPIRQGTAPASALWLRGPLPFRQIGSIYAQQMDAQLFRPTPMADHYDIMIHVENSSGTGLIGVFR